VITSIAPLGTCVCLGPLLVAVKRSTECRGLDGRLAVLVAASYVITSAQIGHQLQVWLQNDRIEKLNTAVILDGWERRKF
jgi:hypothetical protein